MVQPTSGGLSVAIDSPEHLKPHRRPPRLGGTGKDDVFFLTERDVQEPLAFRSDPGNLEEHGYLEPVETMTIGAYQEYLCHTRHEWRLYP